MSVAELPGTMLAPAKLNLCLYVGPKREDGLHEIRSLFEPLELADELKLSEAAAGRGDHRGHRGPGPDRQGARRPARERLGRPAAADRGHEAGARWRRGWAAGAPTPPRSCGSRAGEVEGLRAIAAGIGADVPSQLQPRACLVAGAGEVIEPAPPPARAWRGADPAAGGAGDRGGLRRGRSARHAAGRVRARGDPAAAPRRGGRGRARRSTTASIWSTTCSRRRSRCGRRSRTRCAALEEAGRRARDGHRVGPDGVRPLSDRGRGRGRRGGPARAIPRGDGDRPARHMKGRAHQLEVGPPRPAGGRDRRLLRLPRRPAAHRPRGGDPGSLQGTRRLDLPAGRRARLPRDRRVRRADRAGRVHGDARRRGRRAGRHLAAADPGDHLALRLRRATPSASCSARGSAAGSSSSTASASGSPTSA